jgi:anti-sigma factor RsiW
MIPWNPWFERPSKGRKAHPECCDDAVISCHQLIEFCFDYVDGALPDDEQLKFRRHLAQCPDCVTFFETYRKTPELSRQALAAQIPPSVKDSVRSYLQARRGE